jgi:hypothetical protein
MAKANLCAKDSNGAWLNDIDGQIFAPAASARHVTAASVVHHAAREPPRAKLNRPVERRARRSVDELEATLRGISPSSGSPNLSRPR